MQISVKSLPNLQDPARFWHEFQFFLVFLKSSNSITTVSTLHEAMTNEE